MISLFGPPEPTLLERLKDSVAKTKTELSARVEQILTGDRPVDAEVLKELEIRSAQRRHRRAHHQRSPRRHARSRSTSTSSLTRKTSAVPSRKKFSRFSPRPAAKINLDAQVASGPRVIVIVGVNGAGKTTTIGKLAQRLQGRRTRAALRRRYFPRRRHRAARNLGPTHRRESISQNPGADPSAVLFDALAAAKRPQDRLRDRRYRRPPADQNQPDGGARKNEPHRRASFPARRTKSCWCSTPPPARTAWTGAQIH